MDLTNLPGNSNRERDLKAKEERQRRVSEKVVSGTVKTNKKNAFGKLLGLFIEEDIHSVKNYVLSDVIIPTIKGAIVETFQASVERLFYGESRRGKTSGNGVIKSSLTSQVNYNRLSSGGNKPTFTSGRTKDFEELTFETRGEAEAVLSQMQDIIEQYDNVSIADMYDLAGLTSEYTDLNYGWTNISKAYTERARGGGYTLKLPKAEPLK